MPTIADAYRFLAADIANHRGRKSAIVPLDPNDAAHWIIHKVLERHCQEESPYRRSKADSKSSSSLVKWYWDWPYLMRLKIQTHKFLMLIEDDQRYIVTAREAGIPWRGDEIDFFRRVVGASFATRQSEKVHSRRHVK
jgi:hypothetical protein